jgi:low affinity Fe/Cu permease
MAIREFTLPGIDDTARRVKEDLPNLFSLLAFLCITALLFRSWEFAFIVTASLGFHELGHVAALAWFRMEGRIHFGWAGAWTWSPLKERMRLSQLANVYIHMAGPFFSILLCFIALFVYTYCLPESHYLLILANFSAHICLLNLLPLGNLTDGGKILRRVMASLAVKQRQWAVILPIAITAVVVVMYTLLEGAFFHTKFSAIMTPGLVVIGYWMMTCMFFESTRTRGNEVEQKNSAPKAMTPKESGVVIALMWDMLAVSLILIATTPYWLQANYVVGTIQNIFDIASFFANML